LTLYYADVVILVVDDSASCGIAYEIYAENQDEAFAVVHYNCATGNYSFGHEIGHLQGADHDERREVNPYREYGHGYIEPDNRDWRTIMASGASCGGCTRIQYWSNPNESYDGDLTGTAAKEDNARVLRETSDEIAAFRGAPLNVSLSGPSQLNSGEEGTWTASVSGGGSGDPSYDWEYQPACPDSRKSPNRYCGWSPKNCSGPDCSHTFFNNTDETMDGGIRVTVSGNIQTETDSKTVTVSPSGGSSSTTASGGSFGTPAQRHSPVLRDLDAQSPSKETVTLTWRALGSPLPARFVVEHRAGSTGAWSEIGGVAASDSASVDPTGTVAYYFEAESLGVGTHQLRLAYEATEQGKSVRRATEAITATVELEDAYRLRAYPNPVRERATIELAVKEAQPVTVAIYDVLGRRVATLHAGPLPAQELRRLRLDAPATGLTSGTYFLRVTGEQFAATRRMTVVR